MATLINDTIPSVHRELLQLVLDNTQGVLDGRVERASVSMFERFGFSGSRLYRLTPESGKRYVVKVNRAEKIDKELVSANSVSDLFHDVELLHASGPIDGESALPYVLHEADPDDGHVVELKDLYERALRGEDGAAARAVDAIRRTYLKCFHAHKLLESQPTTTLHDHYKRYFRIRAKGLDRLHHLYDTCTDPLLAYGREIENPRDAIQKLAHANLRPLFAHAVHGDLHPSNVVLSSSEDPRLVDFAWAEKGQHVFKDFITMESSLRFMAFPRHVHPALMAPVDSALNTHWSCDVAEDIVRSARESQGRIGLLAMIACVREVRKACDKVASSAKLDDAVKTQEYFRALALLLLGQQQFDSFPLIRVIANLSQLGSLYAS